MTRIIAEYGERPTQLKGRTIVYPRNFAAFETDKPITKKTNKINFTENGGGLRLVGRVSSIFNPSKEKHLNSSELDLTIDSMHISSNTIITENGSIFSVDMETASKTLEGMGLYPVSRGFKNFHLKFDFLMSIYTSGGKIELSEDYQKL
jgi:hypothetical protein